MKILFLAAGAVIACASVASDASAQRVSPADSLYLHARRLLTDNDYRRAAALFKDAHDRDPKGSHAGDALFWRAWALYQSDPEHNAKGMLDQAADALDVQARLYASTV